MNTGIEVTPSLRMCGRGLAGRGAKRGSKRDEGAAVTGTTAAVLALVAGTSRFRRSALSRRTRRASAGARPEQAVPHRARDSARAARPANRLEPAHGPRPVDHAGQNVPGPPNTGARPAPDGPLALPNPNAPKADPAAATLPTVDADPLLLRVAQEEAAVESLSERINDVRDQLTQLSSVHASAVAALDRARAEVDDLQPRRRLGTPGLHRRRRAPERAAAGADPRRGRGRGWRLPWGELAGTPLTRLTAAEQDYADATRLEAESGRAEATQREQLDSLRAELVRRGAAVTALRTQNAATIATAQAKQDAQNALLSAKYLKDAVGKAAPAALKAVEYALSQIGKPYIWGAEGPTAFDCSCLAQAAYGSAGHAAAHGTAAVPRHHAHVDLRAAPRRPAVLRHEQERLEHHPHVAIYLGKGQMLHAPTAGDHVRIAPIWWAEFFGATRVVPAPPQTKPAPQPNPKPAPSPTPSHSPSPTPSPTQSPSPSPTGSPTPTPTPSPSPSTTCSPGVSPVPSTTAGSAPSGGAPPSGSASDTPSPTPSCTG